MSKVYLVTPLYDGRAHFKAANAMFLSASRRHSVQAFYVEGSLLPYQCTLAWANALNARDGDPQFEWMAMLHDDIAPSDLWVDTLIGEAEKHGADFVSAVVPVKNELGHTSTALWCPGSPVECLNLTTGQVNHPDFPDTFGASEAAEALACLPEPFRIEGVPGGILLANTGCMVCRLDRPWCDSVWFDNRTRMTKTDGKRTVQRISEDWFFSKGIAEQGGKVMATRKVAVIHYGQVGYDSTRTWGQPRG
jgi:hypothetical protein